MEKVCDCKITKESGPWQFHVPDTSVYVDFGEFGNLVKGKLAISDSFMHAILAVAGRGQFLHQVEFDWLDNYKSEVSNSVIDICRIFSATMVMLPMVNLLLISRIAFLISTG